MYLLEVSLQPRRLSRGLAAFCLAALAQGAPTGASAETGYDLWLRYVPIADAVQRSRYRQAASAIVVHDDSPTGRLVRAELRRGLSGLLGEAPTVSDLVRADGTVVVGTPKSSPLIAGLRWSEPLARLGPEGYLIRSTRIGGHPVTVIASEGSIGTLYGAFHLLRLIQTGQ